MYEFFWDFIEENKNKKIFYKKVWVRERIVKNKSKVLIFMVLSWEWYKWNLFIGSIVVILGGIILVLKEVVFWGYNLFIWFIILYVNVFLFVLGGLVRLIKCLYELVNI